MGDGWGVLKPMESARSKGILAGVAALIVFILIGVGLYLLGGDDQSALEKLRDIALIFIVLSSVLVVILLAGITAALVYLILQIKDKVIPLLDEVTGSAKNITGTTQRIKNTTDFVTEEAMRPLMNLTGSLSRIRTMRNTVTGKQRKPPKV